MHVQAQQINVPPLLPVMASNTQLAVPLVAGGQDYSYHNTDTVYAQLQHQRPSATLEADHSSGPGMMPVAGYGQQYDQKYGYGGQKECQQGGHQATITQEGKATETDKIQLKQEQQVQGGLAAGSNPSPKSSKVRRLIMQTQLTRFPLL